MNRAQAIGAACVTAIGLTCGATRETLADSFEQSIRPLLRDYCVTCHSTAKQEGELDLERFTTLDVAKQHADVWERVQEQLAIGEMPPKDAKQLTPQQKQQLTNWARETLRDVALASAGDPGPVVLRRLSNREYTYSIRDLTGVESLDPAREFPVDGAAGEGFTNAGAALVMSPALLTKYLDAAKDVSRHMVLLEDGVRFSASDSPQDWTDEALVALRRFYARYTDATAVVKEVGGTGQVKNEGGAIPLARYLDALQGRGPRDGLSPKYLQLLQHALTGAEPSLLLDPLRKKFQAKQLTAADIGPWQDVLWRFNTVGHIGRPKGPQTWQEAASPLVAQREFRLPLGGTGDVTLYLVAGTAGDGPTGDEVAWDNPRLVAKNRPDIPLNSVPELIRHLETQRAKLLADSEACLAALAAGKDDAPADSLAVWREYLGFGSAQLEPLITQKMESTPDYNFIKGWVGANALSVLANSSDTQVRIPGIMPGHSIATHPAPDRASVIAWRAPQALTLTVQGSVVHAHPECGNGVTWAVEVRRGQAFERLAGGVSQGAKLLPFGPFPNVRVEAGQVVALVIGPRDGNHACDLTTVNLTLSDGKTTWDLAKDVSPNILAGNPHGPWHFLSQPAAQNASSDLPEPIVAWRKSPSPELAAKVREHLAQDFPLTHPLLAAALRSFRASTPGAGLTAQAPSALELKIPAALAAGSEFVVTARLKSAGEGSVQCMIRLERPDAPVVDIMPELPTIVGEGSPAKQRLERAFDEFRALFPSVLCYTRIVPIDEVVTLTLYHREDSQLQRLMLSDAEIQELDRLWRDLRFVSQAPLKQVDAFEQIYQFATQDRPDLVKEFEPLRAPTHKAAAEFRELQLRADGTQREAVIEFAARAWRRPLTDAETTALRALPPRLMLARILTSPAFLYRGEKAPAKTGPVDDWELATRLSYFLWASAPDDELRQLAAAGKLHEPGVLAAQTRRMLGDEKIRRLATEFGCQYLHVRDVATLDEKSERHFPTFVDVRDDMQEEVTRFFIDMFQNNRGVTSLLDADYTYLNKPLADHYGIPFDGTDWRRVEGLKKHGRGGVLGFAATLAKHSGASRTSAILRGTWLAEVVLGEKIPNPPKGVPTLPEEPPAGLSERQLIERHSSDARCAGCHKRIDPYGFALEGFDAIGRLRAAETKTELFDGTSVAGLEGLRDYLTKQRRDDFLRQFNRKLIGYALGRSVQLSDQPLIDSLVTTEGGRVGDLIERIVLSPQFREIRGRDAQISARIPRTDSP